MRNRVPGWLLAVVAVLAAVALPVAWLSARESEDTAPSPRSTGSPSNGSPTESTPAAPSSGEPTEPTPPAGTPSSGPSSETAPLDLSELSTGEPPRIPWADGRDLHLADGSTRAGVLPDGAQEFATMGSGMVVSTGDRVRFFGADGTPGPREFPVEGGLAVSPERGVVGWADARGRVRVVQAEGDERFTMPPISAEGPYDAVAVTSEDCVEGRSSDAGCSVFVNTVGASAQSWITTSHGFADRWNESILTLTAWRDGYAAGITEVRDDGTCSAVVKPERNAPEWTTCAHRLMAFSPDGSRVFGVGSYGDGFGETQVAILDTATGEVALDLLADEEHQASITGYAWEDEDHVLLVAYADGEWSVVRLAADGTMEYAVAPRAGTQEDAPFLLRS